MFSPDVILCGWLSLKHQLTNYAAVEEDCTNGLVIEVVDDSDKIGADVVVLHGCLRSCMQNPRAFVKSMETSPWSWWCWRYFSQRIRTFKICSWCSYLLWSLPFLQRWYSPLVASICLAWSSTWLFLGDGWGWLFGSSGTAAGCLSWEVWWLWTWSKVLAVLQCARSYCRSLWESWLHPLFLLGPVLLGRCWLKLTSLSSVIVLQPPLLKTWYMYIYCTLK